MILGGKHGAAFQKTDQIRFEHIAPLHVVTLKALIRAEKRNKGILLTDHMYRHVTDVADRLYVLANGQTYLTQDAEDLVRYGYLNHL